MPVRFRVYGRNELAAAVARIDMMARRKGTAYVGTNLVDPPYPYFLEYGTSRMEAKPHVRPAFLGAKNDAQEAAADALRQFIAAGHFQGQFMQRAAEAGGLVFKTAWQNAIRDYPLVRTGTYMKSIHVTSDLT